MATSPDTIEFILDKLNDRKRFAARAMFGEYALYADGKTIALVCDDLLYVKILPASEALRAACETGEPYPGAKPHYIVTEDQLATLSDLPSILCDIAASLPAKKLKSEAKKRGTVSPSAKVCSRGHHCTGKGPCPMCWPGYYREK